MFAKKIRKVTDRPYSEGIGLEELTSTKYTTTPAAGIGLRPALGLLTQRDSSLAKNCPYIPPLSPSPPSFLPLFFSLFSFPPPPFPLSPLPSEPPNLQSSLNSSHDFTISSSCSILMTFSWSSSSKKSSMSDSPTNTGTRQA